MFAVGSADGSGAATPTDEPADQSTDEPADEGTDEPTNDPVEELGGFNVGLLLGVLLLVAIVGAIAYVRIGQE
ncbi:hypothetical protein HUG10_14325 [Halorarum halophilum]|uniref:Uncharacterized protein n=1 Tax=Halorarum halophilum TaxID=2743090 RepID=A0A7D5GFZ6_9EURY|nr:hypothetical protein [Halobaculum halophilum]QLG28648.1 hypothetical protein HUG10_14325 [Halobaculum halophilum]